MRPDPVAVTLGSASLLPPYVACFSFVPFVPFVMPSSSQRYGASATGIGTDVAITPERITPEFTTENAKMIREFIGLGIFDKDRNPDLTLFPTDLNVSDRMDVLAGLLSARGLSDARIEKVLGANFARVMTEVWG